MKKAVLGILIALLLSIFLMMGGCDLDSKEEDNVPAGVTVTIPAGL